MLVLNNIILVISCIIGWWMINLCQTICMNIIYWLIILKMRKYFFWTIYNWLFDWETTIYVAIKTLFFHYNPVREGEEIIYLGDSRSTPVISKGKILLKLTSRKTLSLSNVLYVPNIIYNLVHVYMLGKARISVL